MAYWPYPVSCGGFAADPVAVLSGPAGVENGTKPTELALRRVLDDPKFDWLGFGEGWRLVAEDSDSAKFVAGWPREGLRSMSLELHEGEWKLVGSGTCAFTSLVYGGYYAGSWGFSPEQPALGPNTRRVRVKLTAGPCSSGMSLSDRAHYVFRQLGRRLLMSVWINPLPPGVYTCRGVVEPTVAVKLPGRLGKRKLYDGGTYPPRPAAETRSPYPFASRSAFLRQ